MWVIAGIVAIAAVIALIEVPRLLKSKWHKELWVFLILLAAGTGLNIGLKLHWNIPSPLYLMIDIYKPISRLFYGE
ncbi:hypothetical protein [Paenibacillus sp. RC67]|uniref:hypothetical protein n=1 Tax=Paenibacillus sp. RC67 TaxID=3039392 RepID=UPI0024AD6C3E|nr:hypothetical protein [Paenibacillus sp. RC67]